MNHVLPLVVAAACSSPSNQAPDAPRMIDAAIDAAPCPADRFFTGEYVDWDSGSMSEGFCGIMGATFQVHGDPAISHVTAPNGRFQLCLASATATQVDITPPAGNSPCTNPAAAYTLPGITIADPAVIASGQLVSTRNFTDARVGTLGVTLDSTKAQVLVDIDGTPAAVSISAASDAAQAFDGTTWGPGATGEYVYFPNVDVTAGTTMVSMSGATAGAGTVPVAANTFTYVTLVAP